MPQNDNASARVVTGRIVASIKAIIATDARINNKSKFAAAVGVSPVVLSRWFTNKANVTTGQLYTICHRFRLNPLYLIFGSGGMFLDGDSSTRQMALKSDVSRLDHRVAELEMRIKQATKKRKSAASH